MKTIVQNLAVEYSDEGEGPVVLMLHGWKDSLRTFDAIVPKLTGCRIVRLDLPGFGESEMPKEPWDISEYVKFVKSFIAKLDLNVDTLVGHSFGGRITVKGVGSGELKPRRIVLVSAAGLANRRTIRNHALTFISKIGRFVTSIPPFSFWREKLRRKLYESIGSDYFAAGALKQTFVKVVGEDLAAFAQKITIPTLVIWGKDDDTTPLEQAQRISSLIQGSSLRILDGAGHFVHRERADEVGQLIKEFI